MMFDFSRQLGKHEALVRLVRTDGTQPPALLVERIQSASNRFGFTFRAGRELIQRDAEPQFLLRHMIALARGPFSDADVEWATHQLGTFDSVSIAFSYLGHGAMLSFRDRVEAHKSRSHGKINFLRPDVRGVGHICVSDSKIVDNAVFDSVRIKYSPRHLSGQPAWPRLSTNQQRFFEGASALYAEHSMYMRAPSDGYFAIRSGNVTSSPKAGPGIM